MPASIAAVKTIFKDKNPHIYVVDALATGAVGRCSGLCSDMVARMMNTRNVAGC